MFYWRKLSLQRYNLFQLLSRAFYFFCYLDTTNLKTTFSYLVDMHMVVCVFSKIGVYAFGVVYELIYAKGTVIMGSELKGSCSSGDY
jgi:hypothetical protein